MSNSSNDLVFSIDRAFANPFSRAGRVWRIFIWNGSLQVGDCIRMTSIKLKGHPHTDYFDAEAIVKSIHSEAGSKERAKAIDSASKGSIVGIDIKSCYCGCKRVNKSEIEVTKQSIGFSAEEPFKKRTDLGVCLDNGIDAFDVIDIGRDVNLIWFGRTIGSSVSGIANSFDSISIKLHSKNALAIPDNHVLQDVIATNTKFYTQFNGKRCYIRGLLQFA